MTDEDDVDVREQLEAVLENVHELEAQLADPLTLSDAIADLERTAAAYAAIDGGDGDGDDHE